MIFKMEVWFGLCKLTTYQLVNVNVLSSFGPTQHGSAIVCSNPNGKISSPEIAHCSSLYDFVKVEERMAINITCYFNSFCSEYCT